jgi:hypothetical protein
MADKSFLDRIKDEVVVMSFATNKACQTCMFAHSEYGNPSKAYTPQKCNCQIYERDDLGDKPDDVAFEGASCEYYEAAE